jgi:diacylglycerol kinase (ATP)
MNPRNGAPHVLIVHNPAAGIMNAHFVRRKVEDHFARLGWLHTVYETRLGEAVEPVVRTYLTQGVDVVVAVGGDGTISAAAGGLEESSIPLGIVPTGTWNALARNLHIPGNLDQALNLITSEHTTRSLDLMVARGRYYILNISVGISPTIMNGTPRQSKRRFGVLAYFWSLVFTLFGSRSRLFLIRVDGENYRLRACEIMLVNSSIFGIGELPTSLDIHPDDGIIHVCVLKTRTLPGILRVAFNILLRRKNSPHPNELKCIKAYSEIAIHSRKPLLVQGDGDVLGRTPLRVQVKPNAVRVIVPLSRGIDPP